jgi:polyhydroxyalkanoate synthesis regulator phasin
MEKLKEILYVGFGFVKETETRFKEEYDKYLAKGKREDKFNTVEDVCDGIESRGVEFVKKVENKVNKFLSLLLSK